MSSLVLVTEKGIDDNGHNGPLPRPYGLNIHRRPPAIGAPSIADPPAMKWAWMPERPASKAPTQIPHCDEAAAFRDTLETAPCYNSPTGLMEADNAVVTSTAEEVRKWQ